MLNFQQVGLNMQIGAPTVQVGTTTLIHRTSSHPHLAHVLCLC